MVINKENQRDSLMKIFLQMKPFSIKIKPLYKKEIQRIGKIASPNRVYEQF